MHSHSELFCAGFATQRPVPIRRARDRLQRVGALFGGTTPLVTAWLVDRTGDLMMPAYYLMGASFIGIVPNSRCTKPRAGRYPAPRRVSRAVRKRRS
ncbi:hypothetical protein WT83_30395 [Burkholderia territorii]|uniref:MFS transporter n=1 Tax=Burkholderia territorii TaxID=1503055 RepID=A0A108E5C9_9BURK|nr:hypothetical protein WT83_30395 [Burkholderia territorii]